MSIAHAFFFLLGSLLFAEGIMQALEGSYKLAALLMFALTLLISIAIAIYKRAGY